MKKLTDEEWQKVMDQTDGHKVARALYEAFQKHWEAPMPKSWDKITQGEREFYVKVAGELFDNGVIEGGHALPKLYN